MKKHISFDLWGTIILSHSEYKNERAKLFSDFISEKFGIHHMPTHVFSVIKKEEKVLDVIQEETHEQIGVNAALIWILYHNGVEACQIKIEHLEELKSRLHDLLLQYPPVVIPGVMELFDGLLERGITSNILSNTCLIPGSHLEEFLIRSGIRKFISFTLYSDQYKFCKPSESYFKLVVDGLDERKQIIHIGDNPVTDGIAEKYGMGYILVSHKSDSPLPKISDTIKIIDSYVVS